MRPVSEAVNRLTIPRWARRLGRPVRRASIVVERARNGMFHGWGRPPRWPRHARWWFGPEHPHDGREVTVLASGRSFTLAPAELRGRRVRYRGHRYDGTIRPTRDQLHTILLDEGIEPGAAAVDAAALAAISSIEGGFDALQTYDSARFSWGFVQFAATGGLPALILAIESEQPGAFERYFGAAGIGVEGARLTVRDRRNGVARGWRAINRLHDDPTLWTPFLLAAHDPVIQRTQVRVAHRNYVVRALRWTIPIGHRHVALADLVGAAPTGRTALIDHAVHRGARYTTRLFEAAAIEAGIGAADVGSEVTARAVLDAARRMEAADESRWRALAIALGADSGSG